jgi:hypothetical protein
MIEEKSLHDRIDFTSNFCMCQYQHGGVAVTINGEPRQVNPESAREFFTAQVAPKT